ncbi:MAG: hypothetical protein Q6J68_01575 [Thermostichales cyanobacterium SZTDM-1c_bins_54]
MAAPRITGGWVLEAFVGDTLTLTLTGENLAGITGASISPLGKGITLSIQSSSPTQITLTLTIDKKTYPGDKRVILHSPDGDSQPLPLLVMM